MFFSFLSLLALYPLLFPYQLSVHNNESGHDWLSRYANIHIVVRAVELSFTHKKETKTQKSL